MATRVSPEVQRADKDALAALQAITDYDPRNPNYSTASAQAALASMNARQIAEIQAEAALANARDAARDAEAAFHTIILGAKDEVRAQYGSNSDQIQAIGLKKKSDRKRPGRRAAPDEIKIAA